MIPMLIALAQAADPATTMPAAAISESTLRTPVGSDSIVGLIVHASPVVQLAFFILIAFSIVSWAIIFAKWRQYSHITRSGRIFWNDFRGAKSLEDIFAHHKPVDGPLFRLFYIGFSGLVGPSKQRGNAREYERVIRDIHRAEQEEVDKLENHLPFLAITASTTPFIGLFGTVIGILVAMWRIGSMGSTSLAVVAPAIAEALIATAAGLGTAIPAYVFYNVYVRKTQKISQDIGFFAEDLEHRLKKEYGTQPA